MDRNREARRGSMAAMNGGLSRRRQQRSTNLRDSPEEDGVMEMRESSRLRDRDRDRGIKKDRDRSGGGSRSKRRRGERLIHGSNRDEGDDSSEESLDDEDDEEEEDATASVRFPPPPPPLTTTNPIPSSSSSTLQQQQQQSQNNHVRKGFTSKPARPPAPSWKVAEEMIGVSIPRKARTSSLKRPQECGGSGSGELIHRQASTSPARRSPSSNTAVSPSSSNASVRKKKPISGSKHRPPKSKSSSIQEIEIEVAEVLYGMTRQAPAPPILSSSRQDTNGLSNETKSIPRVSSPGSFSPPPPTSQPSILPTPNLSSSNNSAPLVTTAPKRKRPRLKLEDESTTSPATKPETELPPKPEEGSSPVSPLRSEKKMAAAAASPAVENGTATLADVCTAAGGDRMQESAEPESSGHVPEHKEAKEEIVLATTSKSKEAPCSNLNAKLDEATVVKDCSEAWKADSPREEKFSIDLMAPPPSLGNSERDGSLDYSADHKPVEPPKEMRPDIVKGEMEKPDRSSKQLEAIEAASAEGIGNKHVATEKPKLDLQLDLEKQDKDLVSLGSCSSSKHQQQSKQQPKVPRIDLKQEKKAQSAASLPLTMPIAGWPGGFPHFGYMGQVPPLPAVMPMDGSSAASKTLQPPHFYPPPQKMKRCATHCYIAKIINYNQQIARMNPFWQPAAAAAAAAAAAVGTSPMYGAKQHNLNLVPPSEAAILGNPLQGSFPGRSLVPLQDKASPAVAMTYAAGPPAKEKSSAAAAAAAANNPLIEAQRKQFLLQQTPQPVSSAAGPNMLHGPAAFIFPIGQQPAAAAAAATRSGTAKSTPGIGNAAPSAASGSSIAASSGPAGHSTTTMSFNYAGLQPNESQYLAILQNNGYTFPVPAHLGGGPPYRGANPSQAMPFFNGSFYSSPMLHPSSQQQFRQQQQQQQQSPSTRQQPPAHSQQGHQNTSTSSGSSSSQKHHSKQQQRVPGGGAAAGATPAGGNNHNFSAKQHLHLLPPQARQLESEGGCEDSPSTADSSRASQAQKSIYGNFMSIHPQNFAQISPAAAAAAAALPSSGSGGSGSHNEKQQPVQNPANLTPSQAYAMSFAPFGGPAAAAGGAQGLDYISMVQNHALFHSLPEAARHHSFQQITAAAAAQVAQHKKSHHEDGKSVGDAGAVSTNVTSEEGKVMASTGKSPGGVTQHSLCFSRPDNDLKTSTILGNSCNIPEGSSRTLNLIQPPANGGRPSSATPATSSPVANAANPTASNLHMQSSQQQQHLIKLQKAQQQHQQQQQLQQFQLQQQMSSRSTKGSSHSTNNATIYSDRMAAGSMSRFSQGALAGFPPSIIQSASAAQSPQWKASGRSATPGPANSATTSSSSAKNQLPPQPQQQHQHQQGRNQQQQQQALLSSSVHQTQISFGVSSSKAVGASGQPHLAGGSNNPALAAASAAAAAAATAAGSPQSSVSKSSAGNGGGGGSGGNGSPRASSSSKSGQPPPTLLSPALPLHQQQTPAAKNSPSPSSSNLKSSPANNRNMTSILGHPQITPATNSSNSTKFQQQQQQQQQKQAFHQPQLFFSNPYMQAAQSSQSNAAAAAAANFYQQQRRHSEQQSQQHSQQLQQQNSTNSGVLSLCPSSLTLAGSSPTSDPAKTARPKPTGDQKAAPGSENLHWKPEKR